MPRKNQLQDDSEEIFWDFYRDRLRKKYYTKSKKYCSQDDFEKFLDEFVPIIRRLWEIDKRILKRQFPGCEFMPTL